jgi:hypothetical protein
MIVNRPYDLEALEPRRLFAGVMLLATGRLGTAAGWMTGMTNAITAQLGGSSQVPQFTLTVDSTPSDSGGPLAGSLQQFAGPTPQNNTTGEIIVQLNYTNISADVAYSSAYIGTVIADYMMNTPIDGVTLASLPIHMFGVSRGAAICDAVAEVLGQSGVWVEQETYLDPDPIAAQGDPPDTIYDNVEFADNYWRNDGSTTQINDGDPVAGAYNLNVQWIDSDDPGWTFAHLAPAAYYVGTIDQTATSDGDGPIIPSWYGDTPTMPARDATGWIYSDLVGAPRPLSGVWAASGGTGVRTPAGQGGTQWGNITDLKVTSSNSVLDGNAIQVSYLHEDRGGSDTVTYYLDADRNPYNGFAAQIGSTTLPQSGSITDQTATLSTVGVAPGKYWLCTKVTNSAGDTRYAYTAINVQLTVEPVGSISGEVFNDVKGTGVIVPGDPGEPGVLVYVDQNDSGQYQAGDPSATTNADGDYTISGLVAGTPLIVREVVPARLIQTLAPAGPVAPSSTTNTATNFALADPVGSISGEVYNDVKGTGIIVPGDPGDPGVLVYVDLDNSGQYQPGDPSATTNADGDYTISDLFAGTPLIVREVVPAGTIQTVAPAEPVTPSSTTNTAANFAVTQTAQIGGAVALQNVAEAPATDSSGGFKLILTEKLKNKKPIRLAVSTNSGGGFMFDGVNPAAKITVQILKRKGYKLAPHTKSVRSLSVTEGEVLSTLLFSEVPIVPPTRREKAV